MLKKIPLSKDPSPNSLGDTSVNDAKKPNLVPLAKDLESSKVHLHRQQDTLHMKSLHQKELSYDFYNKNSKSLLY